jgi:hypothetical protein
MPDKINLEGQKLKAALDKIEQVGLRRMMNLLEESLAKKTNLVHTVMYLIAPMLLCLLLLI